MKEIFLLLLFSSIATASLTAQTTIPSYPAGIRTYKKSKSPKIGLKAGYNYPYIAGGNNTFSPNAKKGFMAAAFLSPSSRNGIGYRTELIFSRQEFAFDASGEQKSMRQDYVLMPHLTTFTIASILQLQAGGQIAYLLNARSTATAQNNGSNDITSYMKRFDYGFAAGFEIYPFKGLLLGGRYNISMGNPYKNSSPGYPTGTPSPFPFNTTDFKGKNAVVQFFAGYRF